VLTQPGNMVELTVLAESHVHLEPEQADELADGLGALLAAGLLEVRGDHFRTTAAGHAIKKHWKGGLFGWSRTVLPHLRTLPRPRERFEISRADYDAAVTKYLRRVPR
jgi:hypothetical protein